MAGYSEFHLFDTIGEKLGLKGNLPADKQFTAPLEGIKTSYGTADKAVQGFHEAFEKASEADKAHIGNLRAQAADALEKLRGVANQENGVWQPKATDEASKEAFEAANKAFEQADGMLKETLRGTKEIKGSPLQGVSEELSKAFKAAEAEAAKVTKKANSFAFGRINVNGFAASVKKSASEVRNFGSNKGVAFGRVASTLAGGAMVMDAFRSKTRDGQDRSFVVRLGEGAIGAGAIGLGLAGGRAF